MKKILHPEAKRAEINARVEEKRQPYRDQKVWGTNFGWLIRLDKADGQRLYRDVPAGTSYEDAKKARDEELYARNSPFESAWLIMKSFGARGTK